MIRGRVLLFSLLIVFATSVARAGEHEGPTVNISDVELILEDQPVSTNLLAIEKLNSSLGVLSKKYSQYKKEKDFLEFLYSYTHRKILKKYDQYASLAETITKGTYDCLTATTVYSIFLNELDIPHAIVETNYHIYILVYPDMPSEILIETTNPISGFIDDPMKIIALKEEYKRSNREMDEGQVDMGIDIEHRLEGKELIGLLYYNQSIKEMNNGNWQKAEELAIHAISFYPVMRIEKLIKYINTTNKSASL